jgi:hypothetical protein
MEIWQGIINRDTLSKYYEGRHNKKLSDRKAKQIIAYLEQGKEYFLSAKSTSEIGKPLLLYYGVLSLSRALILFCEDQKTEDQLAQGHGISAKSWKNILPQGDALEKFSELELEFSQGTFLELYKATQNYNPTILPDHEYMKLGNFKDDSFIDFPLAFCINLKSIFARIPKLTDLYKNIFSSPSECYPGDVGGIVENYNKKYLSLSLFGAPMNHTE